MVVVYLTLQKKKSLEYVGPHNPSSFPHRPPKKASPHLQSGAGE